jgi:hypothetical protein
MAIAGSGSDAQAGAEIVELGVGDDAAPVQFRQFAQRLARVGVGWVAIRGRGPRGVRREGRTNRLLGPARLDGPRTTR